MKKLFIAISTVCLLVSAAMAGEVTLAWDANDPAPDGYRLYQRTIGSAYDYSSPVWSGNATTCTITVPDGDYAWTLRAYAGGNESGDSNEVIYSVEAPLPPITYPKRPKQLIINFSD